MSGTGTRGGFVWREGDSFAELARLGDSWEITYGFEATATSARRVVQRATTSDYADAVRQLWQIIGYYFAAPEHAERVRRELLERAGLETGGDKYIPVPDLKYLTGAGGGAGIESEVEAEAERRARILRGESPDLPATTPPAPEDEKRPWWKRLGRKS
jgi:hypothetical protein